MILLKLILLNEAVIIAYIVYTEQVLENVVWLKLCQYSWI